MNLFKKKVTKKSVSFKIPLKGFNDNYVELLQLFELKSFFIELFNINNKKYNIINFLEKYNFDYSFLDNYYLCINVANKNVEKLIKAISKSEFDEINIFDRYTDWKTFCKTREVYDVKRIKSLPSFYLNCNLYENNYIEIICDLKYNTDIIYESLNKLLAK